VRRRPIPQHQRPQESRLTLDYGKAKYDAKKAKAAQKRGSIDASLKEITLGFKTSEHDLLVKAKKAREMLIEGHHVRLTVRLHGRQLGLLAVAKKQLDFLESQLRDISKMTLEPMLKGKQFTTTLMPLPGVTQRAREALKKKNET
jgi:translation initiation factor IF-3